MNWLLIVVIIIFLVSIIVGAYRGAIKIAVSLLTALITYVIVFFATPYVTKAITEFTPLDDAIKDQDLAKCGVSGSILDGLKSGNRQAAQGALEDTEIPRDVQIAAIRSADIPEVFKSLLLTNNNEELSGKIDYPYCGVFVYVFVGDDHNPGDCACAGYRGRSPGRRSDQPFDGCGDRHRRRVNRCVDSLSSCYLVIRDCSGKRIVPDDRGK